MVNDRTESILSAIADARIDATSFSACRGRRAVSIVDALASRLAAALERVAHVGLRAGAGEGAGSVFADRGCVASVRLGAFVDVDTLNNKKTLMLELIQHNFYSLSCQIMLQKKICFKTY
jgi:hypothetical protein